MGWAWSFPATARCVIARSRLKTMDASARLASRISGGSPRRCAIAVDGRLPARWSTNLPVRTVRANVSITIAPSRLPWPTVECARIYVPWGEIEAIVPVPLHPRKERTRQFNQARILSQALAKAFGTSLVDDNLCRVIDTPSQTFLGAEERRKNLRAAFRVRQADDFRGKRLVLVDDVYTTGSTANVCALELRKAGAKQVWVLTLARAF